jgi:hypothetical protein
MVPIPYPHAELRRSVLSVGSAVLRCGDNRELTGDGGKTKEVQNQAKDAKNL